MTPLCSFVVRSFVLRPCGLRVVVFLVFSFLCCLLGCFVVASSRFSFVWAVFIVICLLGFLCSSSPVVGPLG